MATANDMNCTKKITERDRIIGSLGYIPDDVTPLSDAVICDDSDAVDAQLAAGADPNEHAGRGGYTPLLIAAALPRDEILRKLLAAGGEPDSYRPQTRQTALGLALAQGLHHKYWQAYYTLLDNGADINFGGGKIMPIGTVAAAFGLWDKISELLDRGYRKDLPGLLYALENRSFIDKEAHDRALAKVRALVAEQNRQS